MAEMTFEQAAATFAAVVGTSVFFAATGLALFNALRGK